LPHVAPAALPEASHLSASLQELRPRCAGEQVEPVGRHDGPLHNLGDAVCQGVTGWLRLSPSLWDRIVSCREARLTTTAEAEMSLSPYRAGLKRTQRCFPSWAVPDDGRGRVDVHGKQQLQGSCVRLIHQASVHGIHHPGPT
jgi:hypothetical protein